jgi:hypothetical protein
VKKRSQHLTPRKPPRVNFDEPTREFVNRGRNNEKVFV